MLVGQGSGRNGDYYLLRPSGVPADASMFVDFVARRAWRGLAAPVEFEDMFSCTRPTIGYAQGSDGVWEEFAIDEARLTDLGLLVEPASTNSLRNSVLAGAAVGVIGSGGSLPTNWSFIDATGITKEVTAVGQRNGYDYVRLKFTGSISSGNQNILIAGDNSTQVVAAQGEVWSHSVYLSQVSGALPGSAVRQAVREGTAGGGFVVNTAGPSIKDNVTSVPQRFSTALTLTGATTQRIQPRIVHFEGIGTGAVDFEIEIGAPQIEMGSVATSIIPTTSAAVTRAADAIPFPLPAGTHDLTFTFKDGSSQVVTGQSGTPSIPAQTQSRILTSMTAVAA